MQWVSSGCESGPERPKTTISWAVVVLLLVPSELVRYPNKLVIIPVRTVEQLLEESITTIRGIHERPGMYAGTPSAPGAANVLDGMLWMAYMQWALICEKEKLLRSTTEAVRTKHRYGPMGFADGFRGQNLNVDECDVCNFVLACWAEIATELGIELT